LQALMEDDLILLTESWKQEIDEFIAPSQYGWERNTEYLGLDWIAAATAVYLLFGSLPRKMQALFFRAINYHGLFEIREILREPDLSAFNQYEKFNYYKTIAKYHKCKGDLPQAQVDYRKAIQIAIDAPDTNLLPYSILLLAKLYSDYWQRKGLFEAITEIAFKRIQNNLTDLSTALEPKYQICADSYAKEVYNKNYAEGEKIYAALLSRKYLSKETVSRIKFRLLESRINYHLQNGDPANANKFLRQYDTLLQKAGNNPKALYIRKLLFISLYRRCLDVWDSMEISARRPKSLLYKTTGEIIEILDESIDGCKMYNDRKFLALAYYERSYWPREQTGLLDDMLDERLKALTDSYKYFIHIDRSSIVNKTYIQVVERLAQLYVLKKRWTDAVYFYNILNDYLSFLTKTLEEDEKDIKMFLEDKEHADMESHPEYAQLTKQELHLINERMLGDYKILTAKLIENSRNIRSIQDQNITFIIGITKSKSDLLMHDLLRHLNGIEYVIKKIEDKVPEYKDELAKLRAQIATSRGDLTSFQTSGNSDMIVLEEINISEKIWQYKDVIKERYGDKVRLQYRYKSPIIAPFSNFLLSRILDNLIANAVEVELFTAVRQVSISIELVKEGSGSIWMLFSDDCGDFEFFSEVIKRLNENHPVNSKKNSNGLGNGLVYLKDMLALFNDGANWKLTDAGNNVKTLRIPLTKFSS
jgi:hypothetical protein